MEYKELDDSNYGDPSFIISKPYRLNHNYQYWSPAIGSAYTSLFIDLVDNINQFGISYNSIQASTVNDNVKGYTLAGIENYFLKHCYGISSLGN